MKLKIAVVQLNPTVGDVAGNVRKIIQAYDAAYDEGADLVVTPECSVAGYPLEDLVLRTSFVKACEQGVLEITKHVMNKQRDVGLIVGSPLKDLQGRLTNGHDKPYNAAFFIHPQEQSNRNWITRKCELPNYGVFDEQRVFTANDPLSTNVIEFRGIRLGIMICEDAWYPRVADHLNKLRADLLISVNGSPFEVGKRIDRRKIVSKRVKETGLPFLYVNMVGGQDELVFDGGSFLYDGDQTWEAPEFREGIFYVEHEVKQTHMLFGDANRQLPNFKPVMGTSIADVYQACVLGLRDYLGKQKFNQCVLGMSGGVDSGLVAAIAVDAIGADNLTLVRLPSKYSSAGSLNDAADAAKRLRAELRTIKIEPIVESLRLAYQQTIIHDHMGFPEKELRKQLTGVADENIQARTRGNILMAISNQENKLLLTTGNKSEVSVGYSTLYGDMAGGFNPIKDCYKTTVWELCRWRNSLSPEQVQQYGFLGRGNVEVVPESIITKPPSAELAEGQQDSDSLPKYEVLDAILVSFIEKEMSVDEVVACGYERKDAERVRMLVDRAEYKRRQAAPGVKITSKIHGRERRYPIVNKWSN